MFTHSHTGHYTYKDKIYFSRAEALDEMLLTGDYEGRMWFWYNDDVFKQYNWSHPVHIQLKELYKIRAQQLRDKYKYLVLAFSGGSDSVQILNTFLKYNIFIDEIITCHHSKMINPLDKKEIKRDKDLALFLEYERSTVHYLNVVKDKSPDTKITDLDLSGYLHDQLINKKFGHMGGDKNLSHTNSRLYGVFPRSYMHSITLNLIKRDTDGMALIRGIEKPILKYQDGEIIFKFSDMPMHGAKHINLGEIDRVFTFEDFFWTRDMPLIPIRQSQVIKKALELDKEFFRTFMAFNKDIDNFYALNMDGQSSGGDLERLYSWLIYPDHNPKMFAAPKPKKVCPEFKLIEKVVGKHHGSEFMNEIKEHYHNKYALIKDKTQFNKFLYSQPYSLGEFKPIWSV
jgi:hypothetical protein